MVRVWRTLLNRVFLILALCEGYHWRTWAEGIVDFSGKGGHKQGAMMGCGSIARRTEFFYERFQSSEVVINREE